MSDTHELEQAFLAAAARAGLTLGPERLAALVEQALAARAAAELLRGVDLGDAGPTIGAPAGVAP